MLKFACVASVLLIAAAPAAAQDPVTPAQSQPIVVSTDKAEVNRIVCKKQEQIGSRLGAKKVCLTVKEWQDRAAEDRVETERVQQGARAPSSGG
jgi:hypothetical protein